MSVIFLPAILGPEMAAPMVWAPGIFGALSAGKPSMPIKNPRFRWGMLVFFFGGRSIRVKQVRFGKLAFLQQNGACFGTKNVILGRFDLRFGEKLATCHSGLETVWGGWHFLWTRVVF